MFEVIGWTIVIAFIATTIVTLLGVVKVVKFAHRKYLDRLFVALILEIVAAGFFLFQWGLSPEQRYFQQATTLFREALDSKAEGRIEEADRIFGEILKLSTEDLPFEIRQVFRERGHMAYDRRIWGQAASAYEIYHEISQDDLEVLVKFGRSLRELDRYEEAVSVYERAEAISPNNYSVLNGLQNVTRRLAGFYQEAERPEVADRWFEKTRAYINAMYRLADSKDVHEKRYLNTLLARARMNWQWERYPEAEAAIRQIISEFPGFSQAREDLAALLLEFGQKRGGAAKIEASKQLYRELYRTLPSGADDIYIGGGLAEAVSFATEASAEELEEARGAVLISIANAQKTTDDPYAFYAAAVLHHRLGQRDEAIDYLKKAITSERRRATNPYTFDYVRLVDYEKLLLRWTEIE